MSRRLKKKRTVRPTGTEHLSRGRVTHSIEGLIVGVLGLPVFAVLLGVSLWADGGILAGIVFGLLSLACVVLILSVVNWRIDFDEQGFTFRDLLRISHSYRYADITRISEGRETMITVGWRRIILDREAWHGAAFLNQAKLRAPQAKRRGFQLFCGYVPTSEIVLCLGLLLIPLGMMVAAARQMPPIVTQDALVSTEVVVTRIYSKPNDAGTVQYYLEVESGEAPLQLANHTPDVAYLAKIQQGITAGAVFTVWRESEAATAVLQLACGDTVLDSLDAYNAAARGDFIIGIWLLGGIALLWLLYLVGMHIALSHAETHPKIARLFYRNI